MPLLKGASWNYLGADKHIPLNMEPPISAADEASIVQEQAFRLRSLLSVDDIVKGLREYLVGAKEWDRTYWIFTSDHGYNLGQFRVDSDKTMVYDHVTRVPFLIKGPGIAPNQGLAHVGSMADVAPTILELVGGSTASAPDRAKMDGTSWAPLLLGAHPPGADASAEVAVEPRSFARTATLIEYQPGGGNRCSKVNVVPPPGAPPAIDYNISCHYHDGPNNSFVAIRIIAPQTGDLMYAEFVNGDDPAGYYHAPTAVNFRELYNVSADYYMLHNIWGTASKALRDLLHERLQLAVGCRGSAQCNAHLAFP